MFHLAPVGLEPKRPTTKSNHLPIQNQVLATVENLKKELPEAVHTSKDPLTKELLKSLDAFFSHGFIIPPKSYWRFVREFLPQSIQQSLALEWNAQTERGMSMAWLKNALNQQSLYFQMLSFISQPKVLAKYYERNACIRNTPVLKRIAVAAEGLTEVQFRIENSTQHRNYYDVPVAQLSTHTQIVHVPSSSAIETRSFVKNKVIQNGSSKIVLSASFQPNDGDFMQRGIRSMAELANDLPRVDVPSSAHEPFLSTTRDQDYMINEIVKTHRVRSQSRRFSSGNDSNNEHEDRDDNNDRESDEQLKGQEIESRAIPVGSMRKRSPPVVSGSLVKNRNPFEDGNFSSSSSFSTTSTDDEAEKERTQSKVEPLKIVKDMELDEPIVSLHDDLNNTYLSNNIDTSVDKSFITSSVESASPQNGENVDGDIALSSGEVIQMALNVFKEDVENFQKLFAVYVDHAVGQPKRRFLLITDSYIYVLSNRVVVGGEPIPINLTRAAELSYLSSTPAMDSCSFDCEEPIDQAGESVQMNYHVEIEVSLGDIDYITLGVDSQSVTIHTKFLKFKTPTSDHEQKQFVIETASQALGSLIVTTIQQIVRKFTRKHNEIQIVSGTTLYSIILRNFVRRELGLASVDLKHGALVYWLQCPVESKHSPSLLEGYLFTRSFSATAWRRKSNKWDQKYFMLDRAKLYQFSDSTCKGAEFLFNIRERIDEVVELELKGDSNYVLELRFNDETPNIQLSFSTSDEMQKWMMSLSMILSTAIQDDMIPVACAAILTDTTVLFCQEGNNCQVDGFMRLLFQITFRDIAALASLNTVRHHLMILRRESGDSELIFLRNESELQRLCSSFANYWQLNVEELSESSAQADTAYSRLYNQCCQLTDVWSNNSDESGQPL